MILCSHMVDGVLHIHPKHLTLKKVTLAVYERVKVGSFVCSYNLPAISHHLSHVA